VTAKQIARKMLQREKAMTTALSYTAKALGVSSLKLSKEFMSELYALPEDLTKAGKKKWRRTGHLRRSERIEVRGPVEVSIVNDAVYGEPRHEAGKPNRRQINPLRVNHWRDRMFKVMQPIAIEQWKATVLDVLEGKG
jgi:hypothetical protein